MTFAEALKCRPASKSYGRGKLFGRSHRVKWALIGQMLQVVGRAGLLDGDFLKVSNQSKGSVTLFEGPAVQFHHAADGRSVRTGGRKHILGFQPDRYSPLGM